MTGATQQPAGMTGATQQPAGMTGAISSRRA